MRKVGLYVHFPFCASKCKYCNFNSYADKSELQLKYFQALLKELSLYKSNKIEIDTIFIGGGTPSIMFNGCISTLLSEIRKIFTVSEDAEITIEANPNSIDKSKTIEWKESGVNRVSIGLQSINSNLLKLIGRPHTKQDYLRAYDAVVSAGITNINTDCLIGLPRQKLGDVKKMLSMLVKLKVTHLSVYSLILEEDTPLHKMVTSGQLKLPKEEKTLGMYRYTNKFLAENGFNRYEVSNFATAGNECQHNLHTWQMREYIGVGAGANGYLDGVRYGNVEKIEDYISAVSTGNKPIKNEEKISKTELFEETVMLGLRTKYGINLKDINKDFGIDLYETKKAEINEFLKMGVIAINNDNLVLTDIGYPILNKIILELVY